MARTPRFGLLLLALIYTAFVSLGLPDGIMGTAWPQIRADFGAPLNANWPIYVVGMAGGLLSSFSAGALMRRMGTGHILLATTLLSCASMAGCALSPTLGLIVGIAFLIGLSNGAVDAALNHHAATHLSSRHMNWLHGFWGVGVSLGTLIISSVCALGGDWRTACLCVAGLQALLSLFFLANQPAWEAPAEGIHETTTEPSPAERPATAATLRLPTAWVNMGAFFLYCSVEFGTGVWTTSLLQEGRGWPADRAALFVTFFWGSLTVGRFLTGTFSNAIGSRRILRGALAGVLTGTLLIALSSLCGRGSLGGIVTAAGLLTTGLCLAPLYPTLMHDTPALVGRGHSMNLIGFQAAAANIGLTCTPGLMGTLMRQSSVEWLGLLLFVPACGLLGLVLLRERLRLGVQS